jgi:hypothetical protein
MGTKTNVEAQKNTDSVSAVAAEASFNIVLLTFLKGQRICVHHQLELE